MRRKTSKKDQSPKVDPPREKKPPEKIKGSGALILCSPTPSSPKQCGPPKLTLVQEKPSEKPQPTSPSSEQGDPKKNAPSSEKVVSPGGMKSSENPSSLPTVLVAGSTVRFSPAAYTKALYLAGLEEHKEVGLMGVTAEGDPLKIVDVALLRQEVSAAKTDIDGVAFCEMLEEMQAKEIPPKRCGRVWIHTHPGMGTTPSCTDWTTFRGVFGEVDYAVMVILGGAKFPKENVAPTMYACVAVEGAGLRAELVIPALVDWRTSSDEDREAWKKEYEDKVSTPSTNAFAKQWQTSGKDTQERAAQIANRNQRALAGIPRMYERWPQGHEEGGYYVYDDVKEKEAPESLVKRTGGDEQVFYDDEEVLKCLCCKRSITRNLSYVSKKGKLVCPVCDGYMAGWAVKLDGPVKIIYSEEVEIEALKEGLGDENDSDPNVHWWEIRKWERGAEDDVAVTEEVEGVLTTDEVLAEMNKDDREARLDEMLGV